MRNDPILIPCNFILAFSKMQTHLDDVVARDFRMNWGAAVLAGLIGGGVVWLLSHGMPWFTSGMISPTLMGRDLKPPGVVAPYHSGVIVLLHLVASVGYAGIIAFFAGHLRGLWAIGLGCLIGLALYAINYCIFHFWVDTTWTGTELPVVVTHVVFSMLAAGAYKGLASRRSSAAPSRL